MDDLFKKIKRKDQEPHPVKFTNIDFDLEDIVNKLKSVDKYSYEDLLNIVYNSYETILDDIFMRDKEKRASIIEAFENELFVKAFVEAITKSTLNKYQVFSCNKIAWDYISSGNNTKIKEQFLQLSLIINRNTINILSTKIPMTTSKMVALARFSSMNDTKSASRVNSVLCSIPEQLSVQTIVDIYGILYRNSVTQLFAAIMYDSGEDTTNIVNYNNITSAIFHILKNMPTEDIKSVLVSFAENYRLLNRHDRLRVNVTDYAIANNHKRVFDIIMYLHDNDGVVMP